MEEKQEDKEYRIEDAELNSDNKEFMMQAIKDKATWVLAYCSDKLLEDKDLVERMQNKNINKKDVVLMINDKEIFSGLVKEYQSKVFRFAFEHVADTLEYFGDNDYLAEKLCDNTCEILSKIGMSLKDQQQQAEINKKFISDIYDQIKY